MSNFLQQRGNKGKPNNIFINRHCYIISEPVTRISRSVDSQNVRRRIGNTPHAKL